MEKAISIVSKVTTDRLASVLVICCTILCYIVLSPKQRRRLVTRPVTSFFGGILCFWGFLVNLIAERLTTKHEQRSRFHVLMQDVLAFLKETGLDEEWGCMKPPDLLLSLTVLSNLQQHRYYRDRQDVKLESPYEGGSGTVTVTEGKDSCLRDAEHYMRYATAAYGKEMMATAELEVFGRVLHYATDPMKHVIARHVQCQTAEDIWVSDVGPTIASLQYLKHLIAVDHRRRKIILAVRGTYSLSTAVVDSAAFAAPFCGGQAHSGMADMARSTLAVVKAELLHRLDGVPDDYGFILTGHSLGAGVACLMTILLFHERKCRGDGYFLGSNRCIECYAFAPPPVFSPPEAASEAIENIIAYCHNKDMVPSLSVHNTRRLMQACQGIKRQFDNKLPPMCEFLVKQHFRHQQRKTPPSFVVEGYKKYMKRPLHTIPGAPVLSIPARCMVWLRNHDDDDDSKGMGGDDDCDCREYYSIGRLDCVKYADRVLDVHGRMLADHMTPQYEKAFSIVVSPKSPPEPMESFWDDDKEIHKEI